MNLPTELREKTVADALRERVVAITTDQTLEEAARTMLDRGVTALAVIDVDSRDPGIITERDLGRALASEGRSAQAGRARLPDRGRDRGDLPIGPSSVRPARWAARATSGT